jgi:hypothetical protein
MHHAFSACVREGQHTKAANSMLSFIAYVERVYGPKHVKLKLWKSYMRRSCYE